MMNCTQIENDTKKLQLLHELLDWAMKYLRGEHKHRVACSTGIVRGGQYTPPLPYMDRSWFASLVDNFPVETFVEEISGALGGPLFQGHKKVAFALIARLLMHHPYFYINYDDFRPFKLSRFCFEAATGDPAGIEESLRRGWISDLHLVKIIDTWFYTAAIVKKNQNDQEYNVGDFQRIFSIPDRKHQRILREALDSIFMRILNQNNVTGGELWFRQMRDIYEEMGNLLQECNFALFEEIISHIEDVREHGFSVYKPVSKTMHNLVEVLSTPPFDPAISVAFGDSTAASEAGDILKEFLGWQRDSKEYLDWRKINDEKSRKRNLEDANIDDAEIRDPKRPRCPH
jgi:hypothetical protein